LTEEQLAVAFTNLATQYATLNTSVVSLCQTVGEIKALLEKQDGRVRALETAAALRQEQFRWLSDDVADLQKDVTGRNALIWNFLNTVGLAFAAYLAARH
jgi:hypothetical protein